MDLEKVLRSPVKSALLCAVILGTIFLVRALIDLAAQPFGGCVLLLILMAVGGLLAVALPLIMLFQAGKALIGYMRKEKNPPAPAPPAAGSFESARKEKLFLKLRKEGRLDRLALVYYVEDAMNSGLTAEAVGAALKSKGWPDAEIAEVLPQSGGSPENL